MKTTVLVVCCLLASILKGQNLPNPSANLQTIASGSYVIAMDNSLQANTDGNFNLKVYGLVMYLLNNNVKVQWSIKAGKTKNAADFTAFAEQFQPTLVAGAVSRNFKAGPFIIKAADTTGVAALINSFYTSTGLTGNYRPKVYRLTASVSNVDIRYDMSGFRPKIAILNDGANTAIHVNYMTVCGIPASNYKVAVASELLTKCFTFASEPHNEISSNSVVYSIRKFVEFGGNFLAQCEAVTTYENNVNGRFQSTGGISKTNTGITSASTIYPNPDLAYTQYDGNFDIAQGGSVRNWSLNLGSLTTNNCHNHATGGSMLLQGPIGASVSKLTAGALPGGLVFYIGNHEFISTASITSINGIRMYMNAALTPNVINYDCNTGDPRSFPLAVQLVNFTGSQREQQVTFQWKAAENEKINQFGLQRSADGKNFVTVASISSTSKTGTEIYSYTDRLDLETGYYRLKMTDRSAVSTYSGILSFKSGVKENDILHVIGNPIRDRVTLSFEATKNQVQILTIYNAAGQRVLSEKVNTYKGNNLVQYPLPATLSKGFYTVVIVDGSVTKSARFVKN